jgi:ketosteroid isomerase-like protein
MGDADHAELLEAFSRAWSAKDLDAVMQTMADDCVFRSSVGPDPGTTFSGRDEVRRGFALFIGPDSGPGAETVSEERIVNGNFAVTRWTLRLPGADDATPDVRGCDVFEFENGRIKVKDTYRKIPGSL